MNTQWCKDQIKALPGMDAKDRNKYGAIALAVLGSMFTINLAIPDMEEGVLTSPEMLEQQRATAKKNVYANAYAFKHNLKQFKDTIIITQMDHSISSTCPSGDGWGAVSLVNTSGTTAVRLMCSTISTSIGCVVKSQFESNWETQKQEGKCNLALANPLPELSY